MKHEIKLELKREHPMYRAAIREVLEIIDDMESSTEYTKLADGDYIGCVLTSTGEFREKIMGLLEDKTE